jgi:hypothetical protein
MRRSIAAAWSAQPGGDEPLQPGMILSNEPGYYKQGAYGIRIENLVLVEQRDVPGAERAMMGFRALTLAPIDRRLVDVGLLSGTRPAIELKFAVAVRKRGNQHVVQQTQFAENFGRLEHPHHTGLVDLVGLLANQRNTVKHHAALVRNQSTDKGIQ